MKLLALPRYGRLGASSRLRTFQYIPWLERAGISADVQPVLEDDYLRALYARRAAPGVVLRGYRRRAAALRGARGYDLIYVEKEALPWVPAAVELSLLGDGIPLVVDLDDAVFHRYDNHKRWLVRKLLGRKLDSVMKRSNLVTVGNEYLRERALAAGARRVEVVPTVIDLERYPNPPSGGAIGRDVVVGWIGSPATAHYLKEVYEVLGRLAGRYRLQCVAIGARADQVAGTCFSALQWSEAAEVDLLSSVDIGIMPLPDGPWERGKCGYKLIQYMACGKPVVASAVGANMKIVRHGESGFLVSPGESWERAIEDLVRDHALRDRMGRIGRNDVEERFSIQVQGARLAELLRSVAIG